MVSRSRLVLGLLAASIAGSSVVHARPARPAPPLPPPTGAIVNVSTEAQLQAALGNLASNTTIVVAPGTYVLTRTLWFTGVITPVTNVGIRGATGNSDDVVLVGPGMAQADYGEVPFGIWAGNGVDGITIANLTIRDFYFHPIIFNAGAENPHIYNVHLIDAGEQFVKVNPDGLGGGVDNGILEYSVIEFTTTGLSDYPKGIDIQTAHNWIVRHNLFRNLLPPSGDLSGPGVLIWRGSTNATVEGNTFINCSRGVMLGADDYYSPSHDGGVIRNNIVFRSADHPGDVGIMLTASPDTQVVNNTVYLSGTYRSAIEYRYTTTTNALIANNLVDVPITARDGASATLRTNLQGAGPGTFVNLAGADLHLSGLAGGAIDQGSTVAAVTDDWEGEARPQGSAYDIGADERAGSTVTHRIAGRVTDPSGAAVAGVTLTLSGGQSRTATSDAAGAYAFTDLPAGPTYTVTPAKSGLVFTPGNQSVAALVQDQNGADFIAVGVPAGSATATFVQSDTSTGGTWMGAYGADGAAIPGGPASLPDYATMTVSSAPTYIWAASTGDPRAPQNQAGDRAATCWYSDVAFSIDVNLTDGRSHQVALYMLDWDGLGRSQAVEVLDAATGAVLDTRQASGFQNGQYLAWSISGHVVFRVINTGPWNAVVSGIFFGQGGATTPPSTGVTSATFTASDDATQGNWIGVYGSKGYLLALDGASLPSWAQAGVTGAQTWTWAAATDDVRALRRPDGASQLAACWHANSSFGVDVNMVDGASHSVALYMIDWEPGERVHKIEVLDAGTGAVLDTRTVAGFSGGRYLVWTVRGHVTFRLVNAGSPNAVLSAVFFD